MVLVLLVLALPGKKLWARVDEMEAQRVRAPKPGKPLLQKALRPKPNDRIYDWHCLPPEDPAGHRKANCRIAQMHHSHMTTPNRIGLSDPSGEEHYNLSAQ